MIDDSCEKLPKLPPLPRLPLLPRLAPLPRLGPLPKLPPLPPLAPIPPLSVRMKLWGEPFTVSAAGESVLVERNADDGAGPYRSTG